MKKSSNFNFIQTKIFVFIIKGQLGIGNKVSKFTPQVLSNLRHLRSSQVAAGWRNTALLTLDGEVYAFGYVNCHEFSHQHRNTHASGSSSSSGGINNVSSTEDPNNNSSIVVSPSLVSINLTSNLQVSSITSSISSTLSPFYFKYRQCTSNEKGKSGTGISLRGSSSPLLSDEKNKLSSWQILDNDLKKVPNAVFEVEAKYLVDDASSDIFTFEQPSHTSNSSISMIKKEDKGDKWKIEEISDTNTLDEKEDDYDNFCNLICSLSKDELQNMSEGYLKDLIKLLRKSLGSEIHTSPKGVTTSPKMHFSFQENKMTLSSQLNQNTTELDHDTEEKELKWDGHFYNNNR